MSKRTLKMKKLTSKEVDDLVKKHQEKSYIDIAKEINAVGVMPSGKKATEHSVRSRYRKMKLPKKILGVFSETPEQAISERREKMKHGEEKKRIERQINLLIQENEKLERELNASLEIKNGLSPIHIDKKISSNDSEATAVVLASDWHIEETVNPATVNNMNKFNVAIAERRAEQFFQHTLKMLKKEQNSVTIKTLVLALLGDFISGNIHDELLENCSLQPIDAIIRVENMIAGGIKYLLDNSEVNIVITCHVGNHTRITKKVHISTEKGNSLESFMYHHLQNAFKDNPRITFLISDGYLSYLTIYDFVIRFHHGHAVKYGGGVGGITIPIRKAISQWQKIKHADLDCFGHFHQFVDGGNFICNGSLIGYNSFAIFIKGDYEKPRQAFFLIDKKRGCKTITAPILFDD